MKGGKDPGCRGSFPWDEDLWNWELRDWIKKLIRVRKDRIALRQGDFDPIKIEANKQVYAFTRTFQEESVLVLINPNAEDQHVEINIEGISYQSSNLDQGLLGTESFWVSEDTLSIDLPEWGAAWIGLNCPI